MIETPGQNNQTDGTPLNQPVPSAEQTTLDFVTAINSFHWKTDYFKFCLVLELIPDSYAEEKYSQFQELSLPLLAALPKRKRGLLQHKLTSLTLLVKSGQLQTCLLKWSLPVVTSPS